MSSTVLFSEGHFFLSDTKEKRGVTGKSPAIPRFRQFIKNIKN